MGETMIERIHQIASVPIVGKFYLVPAIWWDWGAWGNDDIKMWWPVIGPKHSDAEFFDFPLPHYHVDVRFLSKRHWAFSQYPGEFLSRPLSASHMPQGPKAPTWRRMRCSLNAVDYPFANRRAVLALNKHFAGQECAKSRHGWVCPHRNVNLGSMAAIDGVITCPLHGLRIDAKTGVVIGPSL
jgi:hypothetical protein